MSDTPPAVTRYYPYALAEGIIRWLPIDADEETEHVCLLAADYERDLKHFQLLGRYHRHLLTILGYPDPIIDYTSPTVAEKVEALLADNERLRAEAGYHDAVDVIKQLTEQRDAMQRELVEAEQCLDKREDEIHLFLDSLDIPHSHYNVPHATDGAHARIKTYVERVRATVGELASVPKADWDMLCDERQRSIQYSQRQQERITQLERELEALKKDHREMLDTYETREHPAHGRQKLVDRVLVLVTDNRRLELERDAAKGEVVFLKTERERLEREVEELKKAYQHRGKALQRPCIQCGHKPNLLAGRES